MASAVLIEIMLRFFDRRYLNATVNEYAISTISLRRVYDTDLLPYFDYSCGDRIRDHFLRERHSRAFVVEPDGRPR
jgi:hypothetical protein